MNKWVLVVSRVFGIVSVWLSGAFFTMWMVAQGHPLLGEVMVSFRRVSVWKDVVGGFVVGIGMMAIPWVNRRLMSQAGLERRERGKGGE